MEKVRPWCGQRSDRGRLRNRNRFHTFIIGIPSPTHSFTLGLNSSFSANPPYRTLSFFSFRFHYMDFPDCFLLLLSTSVYLLFSFFSVFTLFLVVVSVRQIKLTYVGFRAHVKLASRIVSYRIDLPAVVRTFTCSDTTCKPSWQQPPLRRQSLSASWPHVTQTACSYSTYTAVDNIACDSSSL